MGTDAGKTLQGLFGVEGSRVLVTGAASGLGFAFAEVMADCGARVTLADLDEARLEQVVADLAARGLDVRGVVVDVTDDAAIEAAVAEIDGLWGGLDVLFANAGIAMVPGYAVPGGETIDMVDRSTWDKVIAINLSSVVFSMKAAAAVMKRQRSGRIIVTSSIAGLWAERLVEYSYVGAKAALNNIVRQAAGDLARYDIRVNAIAPGPFMTRIATGVLPSEELQQQWGQIVALGRMGELEEIKGLALLLASPATSFITGAVIPVDGGAMVL